MNAALMQILTRYRPTAKEYSKNALAVSHAMVNYLADAKKQVEAGTLTREGAIKALRTAAGSALQRLNSQASEMQMLASSVYSVVTQTNQHGALDVTDGMKELLDIAQDVSLEMSTTMRSIRANWEDYEVTIKNWVGDIHKGLK